MEAYKVKKDTKVKIIDDEVRTPVASLQVKKNDIITILNLDGMYCNGKDEQGNYVHIAAWTEVEEID